MMTFEKFRESRREVDDIAVACGNSFEIYGEGGEPISQRGYVYDGDAYISIVDDGWFLLQLWNDEWLYEPARLLELELRLYEWALMECYDDGEVDVEEKKRVLIAVEFANRLLNELGLVGFKAMREANAANPNQDQCCSDDFHGDANELISEVAEHVLKEYFNEEPPTEDFSGFIQLCDAAWTLARPLLGRTPA